MSDGRKALNASLDAEPVRKKTANSTVGFLKEREFEKQFDAVGTGTLVRIEQISAILTASHVLEALNGPGRVALVRFSSLRRRTQRYFLSLDHIDTISFGRLWGPSQPDMALLRLPHDVVSSLESTNVFHNLTKRRDSVLKFDKAEDYYTHFISGVVHELTDEIDPKPPFTKLLLFNARATEGRVVNVTIENGFDFLNVELIADNIKHPTSYGGTSGGGLWRVTIEQTSENGSLEQKADLVGVAFWEDQSSENRKIVCHGPQGVYGALYEAALKKWSA